MPVHTQREAGTKIGQKLFLLNRRALHARYGLGDHMHVPEFVKAMSCLLYQCCEGKVPNSPLYDALNRAAGELAQRIVQDLPEYDKAPWGD